MAPHDEVGHLNGIAAARSRRIGGQMRADAHPRRNRTLDGLRGCLAAVVLIHHAIPQIASLLIASDVAVCGFFVLSGLVLTHGWDGRFPAFLARRFVRLWPMYALSIGAGYLLARHNVVWSEFIWWPLISPNDPVPIDPPAWSLCIEAWAMVAMPFFVWCGTGSFQRALGGMLACAAGFFLDPHIVFGICFIAGAWLSREEFQFAPLEWVLPQWLGRISYPLYLSHWLVIRYAPVPMLFRVAAAFVLAYLLTVTVERWSIRASRAI